MQKWLLCKNREHKIHFLLNVYAGLRRMAIQLIILLACLVEFNVLEFPSDSDRANVTLLCKDWPIKERLG